jgi:hypothetical protein
MIRQSCGHSRGTHIAKVFRFAQFVMREAEVVGAANQVHACGQGIAALSRMPTFDIRGFPLSGENVMTPNMQISLATKDSPRIWE